MGVADAAIDITPAMEPIAPALVGTVGSGTNGMTGRIEVRAGIEDGAWANQSGSPEWVAVVAELRE